MAASIPELHHPQPLSSRRATSHNMLLSDGQYFEFPKSHRGRENGSMERDRLTFAQHELLRKRKASSSTDPYLFQQAIPSTRMLIKPQIPLNGSFDRPDSSSATFQNMSRQANAPFRLRNGNFQSNYKLPYHHIGHAPASCCFPGGYEPMITPGTTTQWSQGHVYVHRQTVPTVMPNTVRIVSHPTASAGPQYYGPYWPDGTYSPYRPTPMRDDRFYSHRGSMGSISSDSQLHQNLSANPSAVNLNLSPPIEPDSQYGYNLETSNAQIVVVPNSTYVGPTFQQRIDHALFASKQIQPLRNGYDQSINSSITPLVNHSSQASHPIATTCSLDYREQSLKWAYDIYVGLLAHIQHNSFLDQHSSNWTSNEVRSKLRFYPRPPQRPATVTQMRGPTSKRPRISRRTLSQPGNIYDENNSSMLQQQRSLETNNHRVPVGELSKRSAIQQDVSRYSLVQTPFSDRTVQDLQQSRQDLHVSTIDSMLKDVSIALEVIEGLCQDSPEYWKEGMLLGGCLAYAIGHYPRALQWYNRLLEQEPDHVEAMSNAAAAMLLLGNQQEAVRQWYRVVKLRPDYFEAAEHLLGLLVTNGRTKDAVALVEYLEERLKIGNLGPVSDDDDRSRSSSATVCTPDEPIFDYDIGRRESWVSSTSTSSQQTSMNAYRIHPWENGRLLALIHAKGNMLYSLGKIHDAASTFETIVLWASGQYKSSMSDFISKILDACVLDVDPYLADTVRTTRAPTLLTPDRAEKIKSRLFSEGILPGLDRLPSQAAYDAAISTTSNALLSLAKIYQDKLSTHGTTGSVVAASIKEILALYYLSISLHPSPSTANNVGILLASVPSSTLVQVRPQQLGNHVYNFAGMVISTGVHLALQYYLYGLRLDGRHAHLYTNLGSLLKDVGQLPAAIQMYEKAVWHDPNFDIALANLANAVKDQGKVREAIVYYKRAVAASPDFAEAVCGLATALNSVCDWTGRGGVLDPTGVRDQVHVDDNGELKVASYNSGWMARVVSIVERQLLEGESWGKGVLTMGYIRALSHQLRSLIPGGYVIKSRGHTLTVEQVLEKWAAERWTGQRLVQLLERAARQLTWRWYQDKYKLKKYYPATQYRRPLLPAGLPLPSAPTVLPFHTFTTPLSAKHIRQISQRNALRISVSVQRSTWLSPEVAPPPQPPSPYLKVGYVSSDFNNHPLAHLMQSIFGLHDQQSVKAFCYATSPSDKSIHREQIERESPIFHDASLWSIEQLVNQIIQDGIHILVNLNGYTRGAKNEVFAARPAPIQMSFMGFAGTLGAEWNDYVFADEISIRLSTLARLRSEGPNSNFQRTSTTILDKLSQTSTLEDQDSWIYAENVIYTPDTFFCVDHKQSAPDAHLGPPPVHPSSMRDKAWTTHLVDRHRLRHDLFPTLPDDYIILGNFNQLYKIDPATFHLFLRILGAIPNSILWLLRFPDLGEQHLLNFARKWSGADIAKRIIFTDVAPKGQHITRAAVVDLFLDTPECNAHTTAADVVWSGTPVITWAKWEYKMCSRMASSIVSAAFPLGAIGDKARKELVVSSEKEYEENAFRLAKGLRYEIGGQGLGNGRLLELRRLLWEGRWTSRLFDTKGWVRNVERAYWAAWRNWEGGVGGDIWL